MLDKIELRIGAQKIETLKSFRIGGHLYTADHAFSVELANPETAVKTGQLVKVLINGIQELVGIVDVVHSFYSKTGRELQIEGRDLMGYLVDACCTTFQTLKNVTLKDIADTLINNAMKDLLVSTDANYISDLRKLANINYQAGAPEHTDTANPQTYVQIRPGMTIFEALRDYAHSRGLLFWYDSANGFTFGRPLTGGNPAYNIVTRKNGQGNNALTGQLRENISRRYSECIVLGQRQGTDSDGTNAGLLNTLVAKTDPDFPFYKPLVKRNNNDGESPAMEGRIEMERRRAEGFGLSYTVAGFSQNNRNWGINQMVRVADEALAVEGSYLVYGRTFSFDRETGPQTELVLGYPGMVQ